MKRAILAVLVAACSSGAPRPASEPQPPAPGEVPAPAPETGGVQTETLVTLGQCWFRKPYEYMFSSGPGVTIRGTSYGMFIGGIAGILYYGDLNTCVGDLTGTKPYSYSDNSPFEVLSGLPVYSDQMNEAQPFGYYNPEIVRWGHEHLIPAPDTVIAGLPASEIYTKVFSRFFRMMAEAHLYLVGSGTCQQEMDAYVQSVVVGKQDGIDYLQARYSSALPDYATPWDGTSMTPQMAIGFWLRRGLDGTSDELWVGLEKVLKTYDGAWLESKRLP
jgi:hypothetical protein